MDLYFREGVNGCFLRFKDQTEADKVIKELEVLVLQRAAAKETEKTGQTDGQTV